MTPKDGIGIVIIFLFAISVMMWQLTNNSDKILEELKKLNNK